VSRAGAPASTVAARAPSRPTPRGYMAQSALPLASLVFILPALVLYEVGTQHFMTDPGTERRIIADNLLADFLSLFGANRPYLPALSVVGILLTWHIARNDAWKVSPMVLVGMLIESVLLAGPLILLSLVFSRYVPLFATAGHAAPDIVLNLGAGIYEELLFRLIAFTLLNLLMVDLLRCPKRLSGLLIVLISAIGFSAYHYLGDEQFVMHTFAFRTLAGIFFGFTFLIRGYGITAGAHASYDVILTLARNVA